MDIMKKTLLLLSVCCLVLSPLANGAIRYVNASRPDDTGDGMSWGTAKRTIQAAVDQSFDGDKIIVTNGIYFPIITFNKAIIIESVNGANATIIDANYGGRCATLGANPGDWNTILAGFTLRNGRPYEGDGGGVSFGTLNSCIIMENNASYYGGGAFWSTLNNCILTKNHASFGGGTAYCMLNNCTIYENNAFNYGGGSYYDTLKNCIVWENTRTSITSGNINHYGSSFNFSCAPGLAPSNGNIDADPLFANVAEGDFSLQPGSPCINAGNINYVAAETDAYGNPMVMPEQYVNMGACAGPFDTMLELRDVIIGPSGGIHGIAAVSDYLAWSVAADADWITVETNTGAGVCYIGFVAQANPSQTEERTANIIATAPDGLAATGTVTQVKGNTSQVLFVDIQSTAPSPDGLTRETAFTQIQPAMDAAVPNSIIFVYAGVYNPVSSGDKFITVRAVSTNCTDTVIDGERNTRCATLGSAIAHTNIVMTGFVLRNGRAFASNGGGVCYGTLNNCVISNNSVTYSGGGSYYSNLDNCLVTDNSALDGGGGAYQGTLNNCTLLRNDGRANYTAQVGGGGACHSTLNNCTIAGNKSSEGGAVYGSVLNNCILSGNEANYGGGAYYSTLNNCTVYGNSAVEGGGVSCSSVYNSIVSGNTNSRTSNTDDHHDCAFYHSCASGVPAINGNIDVNPLFTDTASGDFRLLSVSPCINAGNVAYVTVADDMAGCSLVSSGGVNMGALAENVEINVPVANTYAAALPHMGTKNTRLTHAVLSAPVVRHNAHWLAVQWQNGLPVVSAPRNRGAARTACLLVEDRNEFFMWKIVQGAFSPSVFYVSLNNTGQQDGQGWDTAFPQIQAAIDWGVVAGDTILVTNGIYAPFSTGNTAIHIKSVNGPAATVIDGGRTRRCATMGEFLYQNATVLTGFTLRNGNAYEGGGASSGTLNNCVISNNIATSGGGVSYGILNNCVVYGNTASRNGGGAYNCTLNNCTVTLNAAAQRGGGTYNGGLNNCIVWGNLNTGTSTADDDYASSANHSCVPGVAAANGNINVEPLFVKASAGDFRLQSNSPCINAGNPTHVKIAFDMHGNPLVTGGAVNMGAFAGGVVRNTPRGVSHTWLEDHGLVALNSPESAYISAENNEMYKGHPVWHDYVAGTDPTNILSRFTAHIEMNGGEPFIWWQPDLGNMREYTVEGVTNLADTTWTSPANADHRFFRVKVRLLP